jgi:hypothetical protein
MKNLYLLPCVCNEMKHVGTFTRSFSGEIRSQPENLNTSNRDHSAPNKWHLRSRTEVRFKVGLDSYVHAWFNPTSRGSTAKKKHNIIFTSKY